jgi:hypothetical protein
LVGGEGGGDAAEGVEREGPVDLVDDEDPVVFGEEAVAVAPEGEGAVGGGVDEFVRCVDVGDFGDPCGAEEGEPRDGEELVDDDLSRANWAVAWAWLEA